MALVAASAAVVKPEIKLGQALHDYEVMLSDKEKAEFRATGVSNATDAMRLTIALDNNNFQRRRRCMGQRLLPFLKDVQQFSTIVDTLTSSHPEISALVWGEVKLALLVIDSFEFIEVY